MAEITLDTPSIRNSLNHLMTKVSEALASLPDENTMELDVPEPYIHIVSQPHTPPCIAPPMLEECSDIGVLLGVLNGMKGAGKRAAAPPAKPRKK